MILQDQCVCVCKALVALIYDPSHPFPSVTFRPTFIWLSFSSPSFLFLLCYSAQVPLYKHCLGLFERHPVTHPRHEAVPRPQSDAVQRFDGQPKTRPLGRISSG
jgi:hypothetical protein